MANFQEVIYTRYSTEMQRSESCADQERETRQGLIRKGIDLSNIHVINDQAASGTKSDRAGFQQLQSQLGRLVDELARGLQSSAVATRITQLEAEITILEQRLATRRPPTLAEIERPTEEWVRQQLHDWVCSLSDTSTLKPHLSDDRAVWCPPAFLPRGGTGVLFLDELAQATPLVQAACLQLTLDRRIGEYELPDGWSVIAASNRSEDRAGTHRLITPLLNRFVHLDLEVSNDDWQAWAVTANVVGEVRAFLRFRPGLLFQFDATNHTRAFLTPRAWHAVSDVLPKTPAALLHPVLSGCVGEGAAVEFMGFLRLYRELPDLDAVLTQPDTAPIPREPAILYALVGALVERCRQANTSLTNFVQYALRFPEEFAVLALRDALAVNSKLVALPAVQQWIAQARGKGLFLSA